MKLLLDENLPKRLKFDYASHEVYTVSDMGWTGTKNGALLDLMIRHNFHCLITFDKNLQHQQNFKKYTISIIVLSAANNTYIELTKLSKQVLLFLNQESLPIGPSVIDFKTAGA